jgi:hypothetical protein
MIVSSSNWPSRPEGSESDELAPPAGAAPSGAAASAAEPAGAKVALVACGALGAQIREVASRRGFAVEVHCLPSLLHDRPYSIAGEVEAMARDLQSQGFAVAVAYADCGTYGALDTVCDRLGLPRMAGLHCYDVFAGAARVRQLFDEEPGTYLLTDFLIRSFRRSVIAELGLDRHPELWSDYFANYRRVVWLVQRPAPELETGAREIAEMFGLPLLVVDVGTAGLEHELEQLIDRARRPTAVPAATRLVR